MVERAVLRQLNEYETPPFQGRTVAPAFFICPSRIDSQYAKWVEVLARLATVTDQKENNMEGFDDVEAEVRELLRELLELLGPEVNRLESAATAMMEDTKAVIYKYGGWDFLAEYHSSLQAREALGLPTWLAYVHVLDKLGGGQVYAGLCRNRNA